MPKKTIVPCSGGIDNVGLLWKLLQETDEEILVQYIKHKNFYGFWRAEEEAFEKVIEYLQQHCRPFVVLPTIEFELEGFVNTHLVAAIGLGVSAHLNNATHIARDIIKSDISNRDIVSSAALIKAATKYNHVVCDLPLETFDKRDWFKVLPQELIDITFSCSHPALVNGKWISCYKCNSCFRYNEAKAGLDSVPLDNIIQYNPKYKLDEEIGKLGKKDVIIFSPTLEYNNIRYLWNLAVNTKKHILIQSVELTDDKKTTTEREKIQQIIMFINKYIRKIHILPTTKFTANTVVDHDTKEMIKKFCLAASATRYNEFIEGVVATYPSNFSLNELCRFVFCVTSMDKIMPTEAILDSSISLPDEIKNILK